LTPVFFPTSLPAVDLSVHFPAPFLGVYQPPFRVALPLFHLSSPLPEIYTSSSFCTEYRERLPTRGIATLVSVYKLHIVSTPPLVSPPSPGLFLFCRAPIDLRPPPTFFVLCSVFFFGDFFGFLSAPHDKSLFPRLHLDASSRMPD